MPIFERIALGTSIWVCVCLLVAAVHGQDQLFPELPQTNSPVTLAAASDPVTGKSEFRYRGNSIPPVIRVQPGKTLKVDPRMNNPPDQRKTASVIRVWT